VLPSETEVQNVLADHKDSVPQNQSETDVQKIIVLAKGTGGDNSIERPPLIMPWRALGFIVESDLAPSYAVICATFAM
jgi:hypothetical protein